jgi:hypothetical protein
MAVGSDTSARNATPRGTRHSSAVCPCTHHAPHALDVHLNLNLAQAAQVAHCRHCRCTHPACEAAQAGRAYTLLCTVVDQVGCALGMARGRGMGMGMVCRCDCRGEGLMVVVRR